MSLIGLTSIGLAIITFAWIIQFFLMENKKEIKKVFILVYALGVSVLIIDSYNSHLLSVALFNTFSAIATLFVLLKLTKKK